VFFQLGFVKRIIELIITKSIRKMHTIRVMDYETVLRSDAGFAVMQVELDPENEYMGRTLAGAQLGSKGVLILSIKRANGEHIGTPHPTSPLLPGDILTAYGHEDAIMDTLSLR